MTITRKLSGYEFYKSIGSPKYIVAPMVDHSELPFRMLCRNHGAQLCYTPMLHSKIFYEDATYRKTYFSTCKEERPVFAQFCGNDPVILLNAAKLVADKVDAVDINLGCPQRIAKKGYYGAYLMENPKLIYSLVKKLHDELPIPVTCKIRIFKDVEQTVAYAKMLEEAGCQILTVHGRLRDQRGVNVGLADWDSIKRVKEAVKIPVFANGNINEFDDIEKCIKYTGVDGVMSSWTILRNPALFEPDCKLSKVDLAIEYLDYCEKYPGAETQMMRGHLFKLLEKELETYEDLHFLLAKKLHSLEAFRGLVKELQKRLKEEAKPVKLRTEKQHVQNGVIMNQNEEFENGLELDIFNEE